MICVMKMMRLLCIISLPSKTFWTPFTLETCLITILKITHNFIIKVQITKHSCSHKMQTNLAPSRITSLFSWVNKHSKGFLGANICKLKKKLKLDIKSLQLETQILLKSFKMTKIHHNNKLEAKPRYKNYVTILPGSWLQLIITVFLKHMVLPQITTLVLTSWRIL